MLIHSISYDFPLPPTNFKLLLFADEVAINYKIKHPIDAEVILKPAYLDKVTKWGRKWKFKFSTTKSSAVSFTRSYEVWTRKRPFIIPQWPPHPNVSEILRIYARHHAHLERPCTQGVNECVNIKNAFSIIYKSFFALSLRSLSSLFKV